MEGTSLGRRPRPHEEWMPGMPLPHSHPSAPPSTTPTGCQPGPYGGGMRPPGLEHGCESLHVLSAALGRLFFFKLFWKT